MQLVMFSKHLGALSVPEAGQVIRDLGFDGVDLTVRPGGHVLPEAVAEALPAAVKQLAELGLTVPMLTTAITKADADAERIMAAAAKIGIRNLKLGYWPYRPFGQYHAAVSAAREALDGIEALASKHGVRACIHIHSGNFLSAEAGTVYLILKDRSPDHVGAYLDPGHMTLEGAYGGWMQGIDLLQEYVSLVAVKSFALTSETDPETGEARWSHPLVPLKLGMVRWREVFGCLKQLGWDGVVSFHSEYQGRDSWRDLTVPELIDQTGEDLAYLRPILRGAGYAV